MTKEELKVYINNLIDSMDVDEITQLSDIVLEGESDLEVANALIVVAGEMKKITKSLQQLSTNIEKERENLRSVSVEPYITMYNFITNSKDSLNAIPQLSLFNQKVFSEKFGAFKGGFGAIDTIYKQIMEQIDLQPTAVVGAEFDPNFHEVIETVNDRQKEDGIIVEVLEQGFVAKSKVINYAKVKVNKWI